MASQIRGLAVSLGIRRLLGFFCEIGMRAVPAFQIKPSAQNQASCYYHGNQEARASILPGQPRAGTPLGAVGAPSPGRARSLITLWGPCL